MASSRGKTFLSSMDSRTYEGFDFDLSHDSDEDSLACDGENDEVKIVKEVDKVAGHMSCD